MAIFTENSLGKGRNWARGSLAGRPGLGLLALLTALLLFSLLAPVAWAEGDPVGDPSPAAQEVARRINQLRAQAGLPPLTLHPLLSQAAAAHIQDMLASGRYGHLGSDGSRVGQRIARTGYLLDGWAGEIWAAYRTLDETFRFWMADPPHRQSILNPHYREMGVAALPRAQGQGLIVVVDFTTGSQGIGSPASPPSAPPAAPTPLPMSNPMSNRTPDQAANRIYVVRPGDTLFTIGLRFQVPWEEIARANGLEEGSLLQIGQALRVPGGPQPLVEPTSQAAPARYTVQPGDTLASIGARHGLSWQLFAAANCLDETSILRVGQVLAIPSAARSAAGTQERIHQVEPGETVVSIAYRYGVDWQELLRVNSLSPSSLLQVGQVLRVPRADP